MEGTLDVVLPSVGPAEWLNRMREQNDSILLQVLLLFNKSVAQALTINEVIGIIGDFFSPWFATRRAPDGSLTRESRIGVILYWPGTAGMASAPVRRLMLTELQKRYSDGMKQKAYDTGQFMKYNLSPKHTAIDECNENATKDIGFGPGIYPPDQFPDWPHPRCMCFSTLVKPEDLEVFQ